MKKTSLVIFSILCSASSIFAQSNVDPFARYANPGQCVQHGLGIEHIFWRDKRPDTVFRALLGNPYQPQVTEAVRKCVARFVTSNVDEKDLSVLGEAYLLAGQDAQADAAFKRLLSLQANRSVQDRAWTLSQIVVTYAGRARPARIDKAQEYMARLEMLGPAAATDRLTALREIVAVAEMADSVSLLDKYAPAAVKAASEMIGDTRKQRAFDELGARISLANLYVRKLKTDSAIATINKAIAELVPVRPPVQYVLQGYLRLYKLFGKQAPVVEPTRWYNNTAGTVYPTAGKPTLIFMGSHGCYEECYPSYSPLRRLQRKHGPAGLQVVIASTTYGFFQNTLATPEQEMEKIRWYFWDFLDLKYPLSIWQPPLTTRDDGVIERGEPPYLKDYYGSSAVLSGAGVPVVLVDPAGRVRIMVKLTPATETLLSDLISEML